MCLLPHYNYKSNVYVLKKLMCEQRKASVLIPSSLPNMENIKMITFCCSEAGSRFAHLRLSSNHLCWWVCGDYFKTRDTLFTFDQKSVK